jgi:signal transduction histidine kinase
LKEMQLNQFQSEFLATVSHELKTPIAAIELSSTLLQAGDLSKEEQGRLWDAHNHELKRLHEGVEALLEAARCQTAPTALSKDAVVLEDWLQESMERWARILGPQSVLQRDGDPLNCKAVVDLKLLNLITNNLLDNSRKFAVDQPRVFISTRKSTEGWKIQFRDEGWGFDPSLTKKLFTRFFRGSNAITHSIPGTGLGLYLAANASQAMGMRLKADSPGVGKGARFTLEGQAL